MYTMMKFRIHECCLEFHLTRHINIHTHTYIHTYICKHAYINSVTDNRLQPIQH